jgi:hypothetical protein
VSLSLLLSGYWQDAAHDLGQPADVMYSRFLGWIRRGRTREDR